MQGGSYDKALETNRTVNYKRKPPSLNPLRARTYNLRRYLNRPVPIVLLRFAFTLQLSKNECMASMDIKKGRTVSHTRRREST